MEEIRKEAERIIELFVENITFDSDIDNTFLTQFEAKQCALIYCEGIMKETAMDSTNFESYRDYLIIDRVYDHYEQVKQYIKDNY